MQWNEYTDNYAIFVILHKANNITTPLTGKGNLLQWVCIHMWYKRYVHLVRNTYMYLLYSATKTISI